MEKTVYYMFFCLYVAIATTTCFMLSIKPFLKLRKGKKIGYLMMAVIYLLHDWYWSFWHRWEPSWQEAVECLVVYILLFIIIHKQFNGKMIYKFGVVFGVDFLLQLATGAWEFIVVIFAVDFQIEKWVAFMMEPTIPAVICMTISMVPATILTIQLFKLMLRMKRSTLNFIMCGLGVLDIVAIIWNSPKCAQVAFPTFFVVLLINLFFQNRMNKQMQQQFAYYSQISQYEEENQKQISKLRHDMANHIEVVNALSEEYAAELSRNLQESIPAQTGIKVVDCLLYLKEQECKKNGIELKTDIVSLQKMLVTELDMVSLLTNLMDNAIEACQNTEGEKKINLSMKRKQDYLILTITNNKNEKHQPIATGFKTLKKMGKEHGFGTQIIRDIVQKYDGYMEYHDLGEVMEFYCSLCTWND